MKQVGSISLNLAALVSCTTSIELNLQIEPIPGIQIAVVVLPQSSSSPFGSSLDSDSLIPTPTTPTDIMINSITSKDFEENCQENDTNLPTIITNNEEINDIRGTEELQKCNLLISSQVIQIFLILHSVLKLYYVLTEFPN